jgi:hypothetical protein
MVKDVLGFENTWGKYEGLPEVILFSEISNVDPNPLGGSNGVVYRAEWMCPQKINMAAPERRLVALKTMRVRGDKGKKKFLSEVCSHCKQHLCHAKLSSSVPPSLLCKEVQ